MGGPPDVASTVPHLQQKDSVYTGDTRVVDGSTLIIGSNNKRKYSSINIGSDAPTKTKREVLDDIPYSEGAGFRDRNVQVMKCVEGTRVKLLEEIYGWAKDTDTARSDWRRGYWLQGLAGTGKSTVALTVADHLAKSGFIVVSFFFRRGEEGRASPRRFVTTILRQLADVDELFDPLTQNYNNRASGEKILEDEWKLLIQKPLSALKHKKILLVVDAVDESKEMMTTEDTMFDLLSNPSNFEGLNLRVFATARPSKKEENEELNRLFKLQDIPEHVVEQDLQRYFRIRFKEAEPDSDDDDFPQDEHIRELARRAKPLFIAAKTSFDFMTKYGRDPEDQYRLLLKYNMAPASDIKGIKAAHIALDRMYLLVIKQELTKLFDSGEEFTIPPASFEDFRHYVGTLITLQEGFNFEGLSVLLGEELSRVKRFIKKFRTVLDIPKDGKSPLHIFHQSFPDFLNDENRVKIACQKETFDYKALWVNQTNTNLMVLKGCVEVMRGDRPHLGLKANICELPGPGPVEDMASLPVKINPTLSYACKYWVSHFQRADVSGETEELVYTFLKLYLLHWIEAMVYLNCLRDAIRQVDEIHDLVKDGAHTALRDLLADAKRFIRFSKQLIEDSPRQIYTSALIFAPERSVVKKLFAEHLGNILVGRSRMSDEWDTKLFDFSGHYNRVIDVHFSADGNRIASLDEAGNLQVWETATGHVLWRVEEITRVAAFLDLQEMNCKLAGGDVQGNVMLWSRFEKSSRQCLTNGRGPNIRVTALTFSPDGARLVWMNEEGNIMVWTQGDDDVERLPKDGLPTGFIPDGYPRITHEARGEFVVAVRVQINATPHVALWGKRGDDAWSFRRVFDCRGQDILDIALAGKWLVCLSRDRLQLLETGSGHVQEVLFQQESTYMSRLAHVPGSRYIFAPDEEGWICRYDVQSTRQELPKSQLPKSQHATLSLTVSGDGKTLVGVFARGPLLGQFGLWDIGSQNLDCVAVSSEWHFVDSELHLSADATRLVVSPDEPGSIQLYDCGLLRNRGQEGEASGQQRKLNWGTSDMTLYPDAEPIVSPNGNRVACACVSEERHDEGQRFAWSVLVWDLDFDMDSGSTGPRRSCSFSSEDPYDYLQTPMLTFSPDSNCLAMISHDRDDDGNWHILVDVWHLDTDRRQAPITIQGFASHAPAVAFSLDSRLLSFAFMDIHEVPILGILDMSSAESTALVRHSFPQATAGDAALAVSPVGSSGFCAALQVKNRERLNVVIQFYTYSWSSTTATPCLTTPSAPLEYFPNAAAFSLRSSPPTIALRDMRSIIIGFSSKEHWYFKKLAASYRTHLGLCHQGNCLTIGNLGTVSLHEETNSLDCCPCDSLQISKMPEGEQWIMCRQKPFLRLPNTLALESISEVKGTVLIWNIDTGPIHWMKFRDSALREHVAQQPSVPLYE